MADTIYLTFFMVGSFSILLGTLAALLPKRLTVWEEKLCRKLRLIPKSKQAREVKAEKFILERLLGCLLLVFGIIVMNNLPIQSDFDKLPSVSQDSIPAEGLHIIRAGYGAGNTWRDVSRQIEEKIRDNTFY